MPNDIDTYEAHRLARLKALGIMDSAAEPVFDSLAEIAAQLTGMPIAVITLLDADRQWFKANVGLHGVSETPREFAFCAYTIQGSDVMEVPDARLDPRFKDNPWVMREDGTRYYAGAPLELRDGTRLGALCVVDQKPGHLRPDQLQSLERLAGVASLLIEQREAMQAYRTLVERQARAAAARAEASSRLEKRLRANEEFMDRTGRMAGIGGWELDLETKDLQWSEETYRIHEVPPDFVPTLDNALAFYPPEAQAMVNEAVQRGLQEGVDYDVEVPFRTHNGRSLWIRTAGSVAFEDGKPRRLIGSFQDVTHRRRATDALAASERRYRKLFQYSRGLICTHDMDGIILSVNPATAQSLGYEVGQVIGRRMTEFMRPERLGAFDRYLARITNSGSQSGILELVASDGSLRLWQYHNVVDDEDDEPYVLGHAQDITANMRYEGQLRELSVRDPLTGCYNRRYLVGLIEAQERPAWGCLAIDLDHFKAVNDTYGHDRGDAVLVDMAKFLRGIAGDEGDVVRQGGDEFLVLLRGADRAGTDRVAQRMRDQAAQAPNPFSVGTSTCPEGGALETAVTAADQSLYASRAKRRGA